MLANFSKKRRSWQHLYPSEKMIFKELAGKSGWLGDVLDAGCACGGLSLALKDRFHIDSYTGVDIHADLINFAGENINSGINSDFICADILELELTKEFDTVISLSCADWNIETEKMVCALWRRVKHGGNLVISLRLTDKSGINDIRKSFQYIEPEGRTAGGEVANYVVFNINDALKMMKSLSPKPSLIGAYGYWGRPSQTAVTCFKKLVFAVFYLKKGSDGECRLKLKLPKDLYDDGQKIS